MVTQKNGLIINKLFFEIGVFSIKEVSFSVRKGEYFVLTGVNGSGKSLLMRLICGLYQPSAGTVSINGKDLTDTPPWLRGIGYVPQDGILFPNRDVYGNIAFGLNLRKINKLEREIRIKTIADQLGISHLLKRLPVGLSGGERQKVALARALVLKPDILLLDEPVSAVDEDAREKVCHQIREIQQKLGIATLHVSHNSRETEIVADSVGVMNDGCFQALRPALNLNT